MKILVIGSGGREHTLVWKIAQSPYVEKIYCIPGNPGIAELAACEKMDVESFDSIARFAMDSRIDLTIIGPEDPLANGIVDYFQDAGLRIFGPSKLAAEIESSKIFAKELMHKYGIPTANDKTFDNPDDAKAYIRDIGAPIVVKADGLAKGKGAFPCRDIKSAEMAVDSIMVLREFGDAGNRIIVEEFMEGEEASFIAFTDGKTIKPMASAQDHKPIYDGDKGPNTGGMGAYSPAPVVTESVHKKIMDQIKTAIKGMSAEGREYKGVLYAGLMIKDGEPRVVEFNARFGDPETQAVLPRLKSDIVPVMQACIDGDLDKVQMEWTQEVAVCVVMASGGYPGKYGKGSAIYGLKDASAMNNVIVFHAGTARDGDKIVTSGGRVLGVTAIGQSIGSAIERVYKALEKIHFENAYYRKDIGYRALEHRGSKG